MSTVSVPSLVASMAEQLAPMSYELAVVPTYVAGTSWYVRQGTTHNGTRNGTSYANAWGNFSEINWASINPDDTLWVCGAFDNQPLTVEASGTAGHPIHIRLDHATYPGTIFNSEIIAPGDWTGPTGAGEYWLGTFGSPNLMLYEDGERLLGPSKPSKNAMTVLGVDMTANSITIGTERPFATGIELVIPEDGGVEAIPLPLARWTKYWCIRVSDTVCKFASSYANAMAGTAIDLTVAGDASTWKVFFTSPSTHQDPVIGSLAAGEYQWDGALQRIYYKPSSGVPADHALRISVDRLVTVGACIYIEDQTDIRILGGGEYGGLFGVLPKGRVGQCHTNAIQTKGDCARIIVDGLEVSGCRSGVAFIEGAYLTSRNNRIRDCGWHGSGGEGGIFPETNLLHERNWITDVGRKLDFGDAQGIVGNAFNDDTVVRRNYLQRIGKDSALLNTGAIVIDSSQRMYIYRNLLDDCSGIAMPIGAGKALSTGSRIYSNIINRHGKSLSFWGDHRSNRNSAFHFALSVNNGNDLVDIDVCGNLILNTEFPVVAGSNIAAGVALRTANYADLLMQDIVTKRNAWVNITGRIYSSSTWGGATAPDTLISDYNLFAGVSDFYERNSPAADYDAAHIQGSTAGFWSYDTGNDVNSAVLEAPAYAAQAPTSAMLEFLRQDDAYDTLDAPTLIGVGSFPLSSEEVPGGGGEGDCGCGPTSCGVGGWGGPLPGDPSNNSILSATPAFGGIDVSWRLPTTNPNAVAYTKLYRGISTNYYAAIQIAEVGGSFYHDTVDSAIRYYYWIEIVSVNGTVGALIGPASAVAKPTISAMIELLTGQIDSGVLATSLRNELDQISILGADLLTEVTDRETGETTLADAIADVAAGVAEAHTFILDETNTRVTQDSALAESIDGVVVTLGDDLAAVVENMRVGIDPVTGPYSRYTAQVTVVDGATKLIGGFGLFNDGDMVEAGFDVDRFWIGRTDANKRKPFIVDGGIVYIDEAAIRAASIELAKIDVASITDLSALSASLGSVQVSTGGNFRSGQTAYNTGTGWFMEYNAGTPRMSLGTPTAGFTWNGTTFTINGEVVGAANIQQDSVVVSAFASGSSLVNAPYSGETVVLTAASVTAGTGGSNIIVVAANQFSGFFGGGGESADWAYYEGLTLRLNRNGSPIATWGASASASGQDTFYTVKDAFAGAAVYTLALVGFSWSGSPAYITRRTMNILSFKKST